MTIILKSLDVPQFIDRLIVDEGLNFSVHERSIHKVGDVRDEAA